MAIRFKAATSLSVILFVAFALELLAVLSVPLTSKITLSTFENYRFGVFGYCNTDTNTCTKASIGYNISESDNKFRLPSSARRSLSNLLIVHVVAAGLTFILFICALLAHVHGPGSSQRYLLCMLILSLPSFLISLLAFLVDILLFVSHMDWGGWIMLAATVLTALSGIILCLMRRTLSSQKAMKRRANANANAELQDFSFSPTKFQDESFPAVSSRPYSEIKFQPTTISSEDNVPLNRTETDRAGDYSFNSVANDSSSYVHDRTPSPSREYRHGTGFPYRSGYTQAGDGLSNQLEFISPQAVSNTPSRYNRPQMDTSSSTPTRPPVAHPQVIPAGTYMPGVEDTSDSNYPPNVVPLPRIREVQQQQPQIHQRDAQAGDNGTYFQQVQPQAVYREYPQGTPNEGSLAPTQHTPVNEGGTVYNSGSIRPMNRRPSGPRMPPAATSNELIPDVPQLRPENAEYIPPRQAWKQKQEDVQQQQAQQHVQHDYYQPQVQSELEPELSRPTQSPPHTQRRRPSDNYRQFYTEDEQNEVYGGQDERTPLQPPGANEQAAYREPGSPAASDTSSHYTSISQRPINPQFYQPQRGPDRSELVLENNPDFNLGLPTTSRKKNNGGPRGPRGPAGRSNRLPAASSSNEGPYGFSR
ncbi:Rim9p [Sugiyamaella lignohabitans]|uniref:Rim9p n=1 Tax=Sugiyamaella lignohabitans TaxID=796027 RepID=A0A167FZS8_9ASCO|nr:Rim9p [Sugiyamaella lignohabitans]ANB15916.1 Rim9p [Sugiyamaella lignohabitans]